MARTHVDRNAIKFTQVTSVLAVVVAWLANVPWLVAALGLVLLVAVVWPDLGPLRLVYRYVAVPLGIVRPHLVPDEAAPHRFAQGLGSVFLLGATAALYGGLAALGWVLAGLVAVLAAFNVLWNFCAGCFLFYQLRRSGILGRGAAA